MDVLSAKDKALKILKSENIGRNLDTVYDAVQHYPSWSIRDDFNEKWNIGVSDISSSKENASITSYSQAEINFTNFRVFDTAVSIGGVLKYHSYPDNTSSTSQHVLFKVNGVLVLNLEYTGDDNLIYERFHLTDVEEFHNDGRAFELLSKIVTLIDDKKKRDRLKEEEEKEAAYKGKITF